MILLYRGTGLISRAIQWQTRSPYSHAAWMCADGSVYEAWHLGGVQHSPNPFILHGTTARFDVFAVCDLTSTQREKVERFLANECGQPYDFRSVLRFLVRQSARPVGFIGLLKYVRSLNCEKNWDGFVDIFGIPGGVVTGPPDVPPEKEKEYEESAKLIAQGGSGYLPHGSQYTANDSPRGNDPFKPRLDHLSEKLVMAGTGGKLTMLAANTGIGSGPAEEQEKVFEDIARAEAKEINSILNRQFDTPKLQALFPGKPVLAYFELAYQEEDDVGEIVEHASKLSAAGYKIDPAQIQERTSYRITDSVEPPDADRGGQKPPLKNRASQAVADTLGVPASWVAPIEQLLTELEAKAADPAVSDQELIQLMEQAQATAPELLGKMNIEALAEIFEAGMGDAALTGLRNALKNTL